MLEVQKQNVTWTEPYHRFAIETYLDELDGLTNIGHDAIVDLVTAHIHRPDRTDSVKMLMQQISWILNTIPHPYLDIFPALERKPSIFKDGRPSTLEVRVRFIVENRYH
jgi:hypothetical protein